LFSSPYCHHYYYCYYCCCCCYYCYYYYYYYCITVYLYAIMIIRCLCVVVRRVRVRPLSCPSTSMMVRKEEGEEEERRE